MKSAETSAIQAQPVSTEERKGATEVKWNSSLTILALLLAIGGSLQSPSLYIVVQNLFEGFINSFVVTTAASIALILTCSALFYTLWYVIGKQTTFIISTINSAAILPRYLMFILIMCVPVTEFSLGLSGALLSLCQFALAILIAEGPSFFQKLSSVVSEPSKIKRKEMYYGILKGTFWTIFVYDLIVGLLGLNPYGGFYTLGHIFLDMTANNLINWLNVIGLAIVATGLKVLLSNQKTVTNNGDG